eukprot:gene7086-9671_t
MSNNNHKLADFKFTKRKAVLKLELVGEPINQIDKVAKTLYNSNLKSNVFAEDSSLWHTTDEKLYRKAKSSYDNIIRAYCESPRVHKFHSIKEKIWDYNRRKFEAEKLGFSDDEEVVSVKSRQTQRSKEKVVENKTKKKRQTNIKSTNSTSKTTNKVDDIIFTAINPFELSKQWKAEIIDGVQVYVNKRTGDISNVQPQVWVDKLQYLEKLSPREDLEGYEYREDDDERMFRISKQLEYQERLQSEIERRQTNPTEIEQVEDVLFDIVEEIATREEKLVKLSKSEEKKTLRQTWNPATRSYKMRKLGANEMENGEIIQIISDYKFVDMLISSSGYMLALQIPPGLLEKFEAEREVAREMERQRLEIEEYNRRRPFVEKLRNAMILANRDPQEAARKFISQLLNNSMKVPRLISRQANEYLLNKPFRIMNNGFTQVADFYEDPLDILETMAENVKNKIQNYIKAKLTPAVEPDLNLDYANKIVTDEDKSHKALFDSLRKQDIIDAKNKKKLLSNQSIPNKPPDCVLVTLTILIDPPPLYTLHPRITWQDTMKENALKRMDDLKEKANHFQLKLDELKRVNLCQLDVLDQVEERIDDQVVQHSEDDIIAAKNEEEIIENVNISQQNDNHVDTESLDGSVLVDMPVDDAQQHSSEVNIISQSQEDALRNLGVEDAINNHELIISDDVPVDEKTNIDHPSVDNSTLSILDDSITCDENDQNKHNDTNIEIKTSTGIIDNLEGNVTEVETPILENNAEENYKKPSIITPRKAPYMVVQGRPVPKIQIDAQQHSSEVNIISQSQEDALRNLGVEDAINNHELIISDDVPVDEKTNIDHPSVDNSTLSILDDSITCDENDQNKHNDTNIEIKTSTGIIDNLEGNVTEVETPILENNAEENYKKPSIITPRKAPYMVVQGRPVPKIQIRKIMVQNGFNGLIQPKDLVIRPKYEKRQGKRQRVEMIYDNSERKEFESKFIEELANAVCLPSSNISIEEIRRLEINSPKLKELYERRNETIAERIKRREEELSKIMQDRLIRKKLIDMAMANIDSEPVEALSDLSIWLSEQYATLIENSPIKLNQSNRFLSNDEIRSLESSDNADNNNNIVIDSNEVISDETGSNDNQSENNFILDIINDIINNVDQNNFILDIINDIINNIDQLLDTPVEDSQLSDNGKENDEENTMSTTALLHDKNIHNSDTILLSNDDDKQLLESLNWDDRAIIHDILAKIIDYAVQSNSVENDPSESSQSNPHKKKRVGFSDDNSVIIVNDNNNDRYNAVIEEDLTGVSLDDHSNQNNNEINPEKNMDDSNMTDPATSNMLIVINQNELSDNSESIEENDLFSVDSAFVKPTKFNNKPTYTVAAINPDDLKYDPKYWLAKELVDLNNEEKRQLRIKKLKLLKKENDLSLKWSHLQQMKEDFIEDSLDFLKPILEKINPWIQSISKSMNETIKNRLKPVLLQANKRFLLNASRFIKMNISNLNNINNNNKQLKHVEMLSHVNQQLEIISHQQEINENEDVDFMSSIDNLKSSIQNESFLSSNNENEEDDDNVVSDDVNQDNAVVFGRAEEMVKLQELEKSYWQQWNEISEEYDNSQINESMSVQLATLKEMRLALYDQDIVELVDKLCLAVDLGLSHISSEEIIDIEEHDVINQHNNVDNSSLISTVESLLSLHEHDIPEEYFDDKLIGCEISVMIHITDEQRRIDGLENLEAEDVAVMLKQDIFNNESFLYHPEALFTPHIIDVKYKLPFKKKTFEEWESFWVNIIHPSFFGYSTHRTIHNQHISGMESNPISPMKMGLVVSESGSKFLPSGIICSNPVDKLTDRNKETFIAIEKRYNRLKAQELQVKKIKEKMGDNYSVTKEDFDSIVDDESTSLTGERKIEIYRPNMSELTLKDVERLQRVYNALSELYDIDMRRGLVDGVRLRPSQYNAMKNRDTAYRLFVTARQKFGHTQKKLQHKLTNDVDSVLPVLKPTKISDEVFQSWVDEVRQEDQQRLKEMRLKAAHTKEILKSEAESRKKYVTKKNAMIQQFIQACSIVPYHYEPNQYYQVDEVEIEYKNVCQSIALDDDKFQSNNFFTQAALTEYIENKKASSMLLIAEEKRTRKMFDILHDEKHRAISAPSSNDKKIVSHDAMITDQSNILAHGEQHQASDVSQVSSVDDSSTLTSTIIPLIVRDKENDTITIGSTNGIQSDILKSYEVIPIVNIDEPPSSSSNNPNEIISEQINIKDKPSDQIVAAPVAATDSVPTIPKQLIIDYVNKLHYAITIINKREEYTKKLNEENERKAKVVRRGSVDLGSEDVKLLNLSPTEIKEMIDYNLTIEQDEYDLLKELKWIQCFAKYPQFRECFNKFPTHNEEVMSRDELSQFGVITSELEPIFHRVLSNIKRAKEEAAIALGLKNKKKKQPTNEELKFNRLMAKLANQDEEREKKRIEDEKKKAIELENIKKQAEREQAWFMAHTHKFIQYPDSDFAFCIVCKEKQHEFWMKTAKDLLRKRKKEFNNHLSSYLQDAESTIREHVEEEYSKEFNTLAEIEVENKMKEEEEFFIMKSKKMKVGDTSSLGLAVGSLLPFKIQSNKTENNDKSEKSKSLFFGFGSSNKKEDEKEIEEDNEWLKELREMTRLIKLAGITTIDPLGKSILPSEAVKETADSKEVFYPPIVNAEEEVKHKVDDNNQLEQLVELGVKIRVWNRDANGRRANFLGMVILSHEIINNPPLGNRSYPLQPDPLIAEHIPVEAITGLLSVRINTMKKGKKRSDGSNDCWKLQIVKASRLASVHKETLSNPYCEVYWKGIFEQEQHSVVNINRYILIGCTKKKERNLNPVFLPEKDDSYYELPPLWTSCDMPSFHGDEGSIHIGGGYIARNYIDQIMQFHQENMIKKEEELQKEEENIMLKKSAKSFHISVKVNEMINIKLKEKLNILSWGIKMEEKDREYMTLEDMRGHELNMKTELVKCSELLEKQSEYCKNYMNICQGMISPSPIISRLRFMMGKELENSSNQNMMIMTQDPSFDNNFLYVIVIPLLTNNDEQYLMDSFRKILSITNHSHILHFIDYNIYSLKSFNFHGFISKMDKVLMAIAAYYEGYTVLKYLNKKYPFMFQTPQNNNRKIHNNNNKNNNNDYIIEYETKEMMKEKNDVLHDILLQIVDGLISLHEVNVYHKNISPNFVIIEFPKSKDNNNNNNNKKKSNRNHSNKLINTNIVCRIVDYWFLHNPRAVNCELSYGRADWGYIATRPPEVMSNNNNQNNYSVLKNGSKNNSSHGKTVLPPLDKPPQSMSIITDKSDIYGFGLCVYYWVTGGLLPIPNLLITPLDQILLNIPLVWGKWIHTLLRMCLSIQPHMRATAKEIQVFLISCANEK